MGTEPPAPDGGQGRPARGSWGFNEGRRPAGGTRGAPRWSARRASGPTPRPQVWSYGNATQPVLEKYIRLRLKLKPYIAELAANVTADGVPTMRPPALAFPADQGCRGIDDQYLLGPELLVAPVSPPSATRPPGYSPAGAAWEHSSTGARVAGGQRRTADPPPDPRPVHPRRLGG